MTVLVDSSVWSLALRRKRRDLNPFELALVYRVRELVIAGDAALIPIIRQEVLSGIAVESHFRAIKSQLLAVTALPTPPDLYILAAEYFNICRNGGVSAGAIDMTICAAAHTHNTPIFTVDPDFPLYARHLPIKLFTF